MKKGFAYGIAILFMSFLLTSCKLTISSFTAPSAADTGEVITLTIEGYADSSGGECGLVLQIPANWEVISAAKSDGNYPLSEKTQYASLYTAPSGYRIWVGTTDTPSNIMGGSLTATVKILTGKTPVGAAGTVQNYNLKIAAGAFRNGAWVTDDPAGVYNFSQITGDKYFKSISVTNVATDSLPPAAVTQLTVTDHYTGTELSLAWNGYDEPAQKDVVKYRIYQTTANFTNVSGVAYSEKTPGTFFCDVSNLTPGTTYYFAVTAIDEVPNENKTVTPVSVTPLHKAGNIKGQTFYNDCTFSPCLKQGIAGAKISVQNDLFSNIKTSAASDTTGSYTLTNLPIGKYRITVEAYGYITQNYSDVDVLENQTIQIPNEQPLTLKTYTQWDLDSAVLNESKKCDANGDGKIGLEEAIRALQVVSGLRP